MSTTSYSNVNTIEKEREYLGRRLDKYAKFYWRGEDMWATYHTFITNNGSALKFVNGPSFSNEYSSPQYDHAMGNLTGVKFTRMQVNFTICSYGVTAKEYRSLIAALGPYEIDYLAFDYDDKLCYLAKTTGMKEATKYVVGVSNKGEDLYMVENNVTFEVQGEQCALAQRQHVWTPKNALAQITTEGKQKITEITANVNTSSDLLERSEKPFGVVGEICVQIRNKENDEDIVKPKLELYIKNETTDEQDRLCYIEFNEITENWQNTQVNTQTNQPQSFLPIDGAFSVKYDSVSGLVFMQYGESDYKVLDLLLTNEYGNYLVKNLITTKMKIDKMDETNVNDTISKIYFVWKLTDLYFITKECTLEVTAIENECIIYGITINNQYYSARQIYNNSIDENRFQKNGNISLLIEPDPDPQGRFIYFIKIQPEAKLYIKMNDHEKINFNGLNICCRKKNIKDFSKLVSGVDYVVIDESTAQIYGRAKAILV